MISVKIVHKVNGRWDWKDEHIQFIKANYELFSNKSLAKIFKVSITALRYKLSELGLKRMEMEYWTDQQVEFLKNNYKEIGDSELAEIFEVKWKKNKGWTKKHIEKKRRQLILKRTKTEKKKIQQRNTAAGRFKICNEKMWKTRGVSEVGEKRVWYRKDNTPFVVIKTKSGFVHYNRWLYKKEIGPIPKGMIVRVMSKDIINYSSKDLVLISKAENAILNSLNRTPKEFRKTKQLIKKLTKEINKNQVKL